MRGTCTKCGLEGELASKGAGKFRTYCKACDSKKGTSRHLKRRATRRASQYQLIAEQHGDRCFICREALGTDIDHCHTTGDARGLLCGGCNLMVGVLENRGQYLDAALNYIAKPQNFGRYYKLGA